MALPLREFRRLDLNSEEQGVPVSTLMANAGTALAEVARDMASGRPIVLLCGKGNNGGDGFAAAGVLLRWGLDATVVMMHPRPQVRHAAAKAYLDLLPRDRVRAWTGFDRRGVGDALVVDCMLGSGARGRLRPPFSAAVTWLNRRKGRVLACDVPTGFGGPQAVRPDATVTFHDAKEGMDKATCGRIHIADIGIPASAGDIGLGDLDIGYPRPRPDSHKGDNGRVLVIGGGPFDGAPHYAGMGAVRSGADLVHVLAPERTAVVLRAWGPDVLVHAAGDHVSLEDAAPWLERTDALVIGPGLGTDATVLAAAAEILAAARKQGRTCVVDADALRALPKDWEGDGHVIITPHAREFRRLAGRAPTHKNVKAYAATHGCVVLLKGATDIVSDGTRTRTCGRGHPAMTVGGTGDVLAGAVAALLAKGAAPFDAACAGAYLVGCAGELAASLRSWGMTATDLAEALPAVLQRIA